METIKVKIPNQSWFLYSISHAGADTTLKKPRFYKSKEFALSAVSHIHYKVGEVGLKIHKKIGDNMYFVIVYAHFWDQNRSPRARRHYCYLIFKNPTDVEEVELPLVIPKITYKITNSKLLHCLKIKDKMVSLGAPNHPDEGEPMFVMDVRFMSTVEGWNQSKIEMPLAWINDSLYIINADGYSQHIVMQAGHGGKVITKRALVDYIDHLSKEAIIMPVHTVNAFGGEKKIMDGINKGIGE